MEFNLRGFWDVLTWQVNWIEAHFLWVILSSLIYLGILVWGVLAFTETLEKYALWVEKQRDAKKNWKANLSILITVFLFFYLIITIFEFAGRF